MGGKIGALLIIVGLAGAVAGGVKVYVDQLASSRREAVERRKKSEKRRLRRKRRRADRRARRARRKTHKRKKRPPRQQVPLSAADGAHPDYPTPKAAKTEALFVLEEPDRGPVVRSATLPATDGLEWKTYHHCQLVQGKLLACGAAVRAAALRPARSHWRVGRRQGRVVLAQRRFGQRVVSSLLFQPDDGPKLERILRLDSRGQVEWSRHFAGDRFSARELDGGNALAGCGSHEVSALAKGVGWIGCRQWNGQPMHDARGVVWERVSSDRRGLPREARYFDAARKPLAAHDGVHRVVSERDRQGRLVTRRFYDLQGNPTLSARAGCYGLRFAYNAQGLRRSRTCLDAAGKPTPRRGAAATVRYRYNGAGCLTEERYQYLGRPKKSLLHRRSREVDAHCDELREICFDGAGKRRSCGTGEPAETRYARDDKGRAVSIKHFAADRQPGKHPAFKIFEVRRRWDAVGNLVATSCFDARGRPVECDRTGFHRYRATFDDAGRKTSEIYFDAKGKPAGNFATFKRLFRYDNYDHLAGTTNLDRAGKPVESLGSAARRIIYDAGHRMFGLLLFDRDNYPARYRGCIVGKTCPRKPWHAMRIVRRRDGKVTTNLFFNHRGKLVYTVDCSKKRCWR